MMQPRMKLILSAFLSRNLTFEINKRDKYYIYTEIDF